MKTFLLIALMIVLDGSQGSGKSLTALILIDIDKIYLHQLILTLVFYYIFFITNFIDVEDECLDDYTSDHKVYGKNWYNHYQWTYCDWSCRKLAQANYCALSWKDDLYCSAGNLKVQDTCKHSCEQCRKYLFSLFNYLPIRYHLSCFHIFISS